MVNRLVGWDSIKCTIYFFCFGYYPSIVKKTGANLETKDKVSKAMWRSANY